MKMLIACLALALGAATLASAYDTTSADRSGADSSHISAMELMQRANSYRGVGLLFNNGAKANQTEGCCKVCTTGKACGDTCISRDKECHVGPGCACDG